MKTITILIIVFVTVACFVAAGIIAVSSNIFTNGQNLNFVLGEVNKVNVNMNKPLDLTGVNTVKVYMQVGNATVMPSDRAEANLTGYVLGNPNRLQFDVVKNGAEVDITVRQITNILTFSIGEISLGVNLPADYSGTLEVTGATSKITVGDFTLQALRSRLTTGSLDVAAVAKDMDLESTTGSIAFTGKGRACDTLRMRSTTGSMTANTLQCKTAEFRATTGRISISGITAEKIIADATTGKIEIMDCDGGVDARAMTGSIEASMKSLQTSYYETTTGKVSLSVPKDSGMNLDARTTTGRINTNFTFMGQITGERKFSAGAEITGQANGGGPELKIRTTTGSVDVLGR